MAHEVGDGRVAITLEGRATWLEPTLEACIEISAMGGGIVGAIARCNNLDFQTICTIIGAGLRPNGKPLNPRQRQNDVPKAVFDAGIFYCYPLAIEFCNVVANGGKALPDIEEDEVEEGEGGPLASPSANTTDSYTSEPQAG